MNDRRPIAVLIGALGGEGGGVLTDWVAAAARAADLPVQTTSIPGVAQRTGATTYYVEIFPETHAVLGERRPVLGLFPVAGAIDLMVASELVEAGRAMTGGFVTPAQTTLIAATHRVYATVEKMAGGDGRADPAPILAAAAALPRRAILFDPRADAALRDVPLNAVLLGAIAGSGVLPLPVAAFEQAIRDAGIAVRANLDGFAQGLKVGRGEIAPPLAPSPAAPLPPGLAPALAAQVAALPPPVQAIAAQGAARLVDYQDAAYARLYLERLAALAGIDAAALAETARQLALWMSYEDVIRVADLKSRPDRLAQVRAGAGAAPDQPVRIVEYMKPGIDEVAAVLPAGLGRRLRAWAERRGLVERLHLPLHLDSASVLGFAVMRLLAGLRGLRRRSLRFGEEQAAIGRWLEAIAAAAPRAPALAREIAACATVLKGYGETQRRGRKIFDALMAAIAAPALAGSADAEAAALRLGEARAVALADPEGWVPPAPAAPAAEEPQRAA